MDEYLPPVVIDIAVNNAAALAKMEETKAAMADMSVSAGASAGKVSSAEKDLESKSSGFHGRMAMLFESLGNSMSSFGLPFGNSVKKMGYAMKEGEAAEAGFGSSLMHLGAMAAGAGALLVAGIAVAAIKAADQFDVAQTKLQQAVQDTGHSFAAAKPEIEGTEKAGVKLGFTMSESAEALAKLTVSTRSVTKAQSEMGTAEDLARFKHISLAQAAETLAKVNAGSNRALLQLGINLDLGSAKLANIQKATEAVTSARAKLKSAEEAVAAATKKAAEEHEAALQKVKAAEENLKSAQETLKGGTEGLTAAKHALKEAEQGVTETTLKEKQAVKEATQALKEAEENAAETARSGAASVAAAKEGLSSVEQERVKESNEAAIKTIENEEKSLEATKTASSEAALAQLRSKKAALEAADKGMETQKKEDALQKAHKAVIESEANAHNANRKALDSVTKAHEALIQREKDARESSKESVAAAERVTAAQRGVSAAERTLASDHRNVAKAAEGVATAQAAAAKSSAAVTTAENKLKEAHEHLSKAEETLHKDATTTQKVMEALHAYLGGQAVAYTKTAAGQWDIFKAKLNETEVEAGTKLLPILMKLAPVLQDIGKAMGWVVTAVANLLTWWSKTWETIGNFYYTHAERIKQITHKVVAVLESIGEAVIEVVKFFVEMPVKIINALAGLLTEMVNFGKNIVKAIIEGITSAPGAIIKAIGKLIPGGGIIHSIGHILGLAEGGIVSQPTLAVIGEAGPEAVVPLKGIKGASASDVKPLITGTATASTAAPNNNSGPRIGEVNIYGSNMTNPQILNEMYLKLRPLLQGA